MEAHGKCPALDLAGGTADGRVSSAWCVAGSVPEASCTRSAVPPPLRSQLSGDFGVRTAQIASNTGSNAAGRPPDPASSAAVQSPLGAAVTRDIRHPHPADQDRGQRSPCLHLDLRDVTASNPAFAGRGGAMITTLADLKIWAKALAIDTLLAPATQAVRLKTQVLHANAADHGQLWHGRHRQQRFPRA
jgi:hypothetical protein